jgi:hypothetical protein
VLDLLTAVEGIIKQMQSAESVLKCRLSVLSPVGLYPVIMDDDCTVAAHKIEYFTFSIALILYHVKGCVL